MDTLTLVRQLTAARHACPALQRGTFEVLHAQNDLLLYARTHLGSAAYVVMNTATRAQVASLSALPAGTYRDAVSGRTVQVTSGAVLDVPGRTPVVLIRD